MCATYFYLTLVTLSHRVILIGESRYRPEFGVSEREIILSRAWSRIEGWFPGTRTPRYGSVSLLGMLTNVIPNSGV